MSGLETVATGTARELVVTEELVRELAVTGAPGPVISVHLRTDPRDPANTSHVPAWLIALRNGLRAIGAEIEARGERAERLAFRELGPAIERDLTRLSPARRGRSVSYFAGPDGVTRMSHQLALRRDEIHWDERPYISPLVDLVERGRATGLVLVGADTARVLQWQDGRVEEPARSQFTLELGDWRDYAGPAAADPARGQQTVSHQEAFAQRVEDWRRRWVQELAAAIADRTRTLGWERLLVAGAPELTGELVRAFPDDVASSVLAETDVNVLGLEPAAIAERLEAVLEEATEAKARATVAGIRESWDAGHPAALGPDRVLRALVARQVEHLVLDTTQGYSSLGEDARRVLAGAPERLLSERAVEAAVASGARVTTLRADAHPALEEAGGMIALLRY